MKHNPDYHHRQSIRLRGYDYRSIGAYFVTICTFQRECILDDPEIARVVRLSWRSANDGWEAPVYELVVMPNHIHGIVWLGRQRGVVGGRGVVRAQRGPLADVSQFGRCGRINGCIGGEGAAPLQSGSLSAIVGAFKSPSTKRINRLREAAGRPVWQRNYHERIIRGERELAAARKYILDNPMKWDADPNNPAPIP
jgi:REP element-mobilizing transposase RayT